jgi:hypothetical protein
VAEYCWVPPLPKQGKMTTETVSAVAEDDFQRQSLDINMPLLVRDSSQHWDAESSFFPR